MVVVLGFLFCGSCGVFCGVFCGLRLVGCFVVCFVTCFWGLVVVLWCL